MFNSNILLTCPTLALCFVLAQHRALFGVDYFLVPDVIERIVHVFLRAFLGNYIRIETYSHFMEIT